MQVLRLLVFSVWFCLALTTQSNADSVVKLTNGEWKPFQSEGLPDYGPYSRLVRRAFELGGYQVEFGFFPWKRAISLVEDGFWDGTFFWVKTRERDENFLLSNTVFHHNEVIFLRTQSLAPATRLDDFDGKIMGRLAGSAFGAQFNDKIDEGKIHVIEAKTNEQLFSLLSMGRVDFIPELHASGYETLAALKVDNIRHTEQLKIRWTYHLMLSKKIPNSSALMTAFHTGLTVLKNSGEFDEILNSVAQIQ